MIKHHDCSGSQQRLLGRVKSGLLPLSFSQGAAFTLNISNTQTSTPSIAEEFPRWHDTRHSWTLLFS